ncbi:hypothetical protein ACYAD5_004963, partial [Enterobacter cloacae]
YLLYLYFQNNRNIACVNRFCREGTAFPIMLCPPGYGGQSQSTTEILANTRAGNNFRPLYGRKKN